MLQVIDVELVACTEKLSVQTPALVVCLTSTLFSFQLAVKRMRWAGSWFHGYSYFFHILIPIMERRFQAPLSLGLPIQMAILAVTKRLGCGNYSESKM